MPATITAADFLPQRINLTSLREAAAECRGCELFKNATQTVFGEGRRTARVILVGEMPGDREDREGKPFVGPAGRLLNESLLEAGIDRDDIYVTNAVKHFRWEPMGNRRLHKKPRWREIQACKPWLQAEILAISPEMIVCLGATAAQALLGPKFRITKMRGQVIPNESTPDVIATYHPAAILRSAEKADAERMRHDFTDDLRTVAQHISPNRKR